MKKGRLGLGRLDRMGIHCARSQWLRVPRKKKSIKDVIKKVFKYELSVARSLPPPFHPTIPFSQPLFIFSAFEGACLFSAPYCKGSHSTL